MGLVDELIRMTRQHFAIARHVWQSREARLPDDGGDRSRSAAPRLLSGSRSSASRGTIPGSPGIAEARALLPRARRRARQAGGVGRRRHRGPRRERSRRAPSAVGLLHQRVADSRGLAVLCATCPSKPQPLRASMVDLSRTRAWAEGGYYARVFLNVAGPRARRVRAGRARRCAVRAELQLLCARSRAPDGAAWKNLVEAPADLYRAVQRRCARSARGIRRPERARAGDRGQ